MYRLTPRMEQHFRRSLKAYHELFDGGRCDSWELEELIVNAIKSDTTANHLPQWTEKGHNDYADIIVKDGNKEHGLQIKSGQIKRGKEFLWLTLSGHRLGRFAGNLDAITNYLNTRTADVISVPYRKHESDHGRQHIYRLCYVPISALKGIQSNNWQPRGKQLINYNGQDVEFSLRPSMSWQIWWKIPLSILNPDKEFSDGVFI